MKNLERVENVSLSVSSGIVGLFVSHWFIFSKASKSNKLLAAGAGITFLSLLPPQEQKKIIAPMVAGAALGYISAAI